MKESKEMLISSNGSQDDEDPKAALREARITQFEKLRELLKYAS